jgi:hypothetical protein
LHHSSGMPPPTPPRLPEPDEERAQRAALAASLSLLAFAMLTALALVAWFSRVEDPWTWKAVLALLSAMLGLATSALVWRVPTRRHALVGVVVMVLSLLRVGPPWDWTWVSFALLSVTIMMLIPLVNAALVLR